MTIYSYNWCSPYILSPDECLIDFSVLLVPDGTSPSWGTHDFPAAPPRQSAYSIARIEELSTPQINSYCVIRQFHSQFLEWLFVLVCSKERSQDQN